MAGSEVTVLIQGETGTGKERVARAIHNRSRRNDAVFMPIHCGALPENLLESELFGHEKGAFTGAIRRKLGLFEQASGGTLFLDEIEAMSAALQVKLLRALQEREIIRVGGDQPIQVDFRLVAASLGNLRSLMDEGTIRPDLFFRLNGVVVDLPSLRSRKEDIPLLAHYFTDLYGAENGKQIREISPEAIMRLRDYVWPGNVRELEHAIEQAVLMSTAERISLDDLPSHVIAESAASSIPNLADVPLREARELFERQYIQELLSATGGNVTEAASRAGIHRRHFHEKMRRYAITR